MTSRDPVERTGRDLLLLSVSQEQDSHSRWLGAGRGGEGAAGQDTQATGLISWPLPEWIWSGDPRGLAIPERQSLSLGLTQE